MCAFVPQPWHSSTRELEFTEISKGVYELDSAAFFPLGPEDGWGKEQHENNLGFTTETTIDFVYEAGQTFTFTGDDDLWLFIDGTLALDIGGLHPEVRDVLHLDVAGPALGLVAGRAYPMKIFHAERHSTGPNFNVQSKIGCFLEPG